MISYVRISAASAVLGLLWLGGCGNGATDVGSGTPDPGDNDPVATTSVNVQDNFFDPPDIVVAPGATVTWTWRGSQVQLRGPTTAIAAEPRDRPAVGAA